MRRKFAALLLCLVAGTHVASAYYHFVHFTSRNAPFRPLFERFDLNALPNRTVSYYILDPSNVRLSASDSISGLVSQIRAAAKVWNDVETSELRIAYGGLNQPGAPSPAIQVTFEELPPGVIAQAAPTVKAASNGAFIPIVNSVVTLPNDMSNRSTFGESLFGTLVHEFGHALGLQHSLTSSVMATSSTRATSRSRPLGADDVAGVSLLYPTKNYLASTGSISGRVTYDNGQPASMASVVAIVQGAGAVSALTNPDGTYRLEGLPPRQYLLYVHPLPPALQGEAYPAAINPPVDAQGQAFRATGAFETVFFPGTKDTGQAFPVTVAAGATRDGADFTVVPRAAPSMHSVQTYAYPGETFAKPPYLFPTIQRPYIVAAGVGTWRNGAPAPGLSVSLLGGQNLAISNFSEFYVRVDVPLTSFGFNEGPRHLVFSVNNDIYVLPAAFYIAQQPPPSIASIAPGVDGGVRIATLAGSQLNAATTILFEGQVAPVRSFDEATGRLTVTVPAAPPGLKANVVALNPDGQSSLFLQENNVPKYEYEGSAESATATGSLSATPASLPAGVETIVQVDTVGANFVDGQVVVGFGSPEVVARRVWVLSPTRLLVSIAVAPSAPAGATYLNVTSGLSVSTAPFAFQIQTGASKPLTLASSIYNVITGLGTLTPNAIAVLTVTNAPGPLTPGALALSVNDRSVPILSIVNNQVSFQLPAGIPAGPVVIRLDMNGERGLPIAIPLEVPQP